MDGKIVVIKERTPFLIEQLLALWESSVRETHLFLSADEIADIKKYVPQALAQVATLIVIEDMDKIILGFMGVEEQKLEMLFLAPEARGKGLGKSLINYGIEHYSICEVTVNEQNTLAVGFYERMGFKGYRRTDLDEQGNPYPLLYMKLG